MTRRIAVGFLSSAFAAILTAMFAACGGKSDKPNVLLISVDTLRADRLGSYGNSEGLTPALDELALRGVRFSQSRSTAPWTLPSHASVFTGLYPTDHRAIDDRMRIRANAPMLTEFLRDAGYQTASFFTHYYVGPDYGFGRGFDETNHREYAPADQMVDLAARWIKDHESKPFFVFLHLFDPHTPYTPPRSARDRYVPADLAKFKGDTAEVVDVVHRRGDPHTLDALKALYNAEVSAVDAALARLFAGLEKAGLTNTIVVFFSDHGEEFFEHSLMEHGFTLYEEQLRVPLIVAWPSKLEGGRVVDAPASLADVMPTILDLIGMRVPEGIAGRSLAGAARGESAPDSARVIVSETTRMGPDRMSVVKDGWKYIYSPAFRLNDRLIGEELYDLGADPLETDNLLARQPDKARALLATLFDTGLYAKRRQFSVLFSGTAQAHKYLGTLRSAGSFIAANKDNVVMDTDESRELVTREFGLKKEERRLQFVAQGSEGANGVTFIQEPDTAALQFDLLTDDKRDAAAVEIGDRRARPEALPLSVPADLTGRRRFTDSPGYAIWCEEVLVNKYAVSRFEVGDQIEMSPEMVEKLKSLGYLDEGGAIKKSSSAAPDAAGALPPEPVEYRCAPLVW